MRKTTSTRGTRTDESAGPTLPPRPIENSYAIPTGVGYAGQYPGHPTEAEALKKIKAILDSGVTTFLDLPEEAERTPMGPMAAYADLLDREAKGRGLNVRHIRISVPDQRAPKSPDDMRKILDTLDDAERKGERVYMHCWGGKGRTSTALACHLVRRGYDVSEALRIVQQLTETMPRGIGARAPENESQRNFVRSWAQHDLALHEPATKSPRAVSPLQKFRGALVGLAVGDALGGTVEFKSKGSFAPITDIVGGGVHRLKPGEWTDDTSMALCLAESLIEVGFDARDQMERYVRWRRDGHLSSKGHCFDCGITIGRALSAFERTGDPFSGPTADDTAGNGSLMRLAPVSLYFASAPRLAVEMAAESSRTTNGAPQAIDACRYFAGLVVGALRGDQKEALLAPLYSPEHGLWAEKPLHAAIATIASGSFKQRTASELPASGYVVHTLEAALWAIWNTDNFEDGLLKAVNLGGDADTTGAVYGQLAGAYYGVDAIPRRWRERIVMRDLIEQYADKLYAHSLR